jgi:hypothetical protein
MKASKKRAARHTKAALVVKTIDHWDRVIKAEANDHITAMIAINKAARTVGHRINWDAITVSPTK